jgi:hypothetical protein
MDILKKRRRRQLSDRDGFLFYRSFWDAVNQLPAKDQLPILKAIICFGLDGTEPEKLTSAQNAFFLLARPVLLKGRNKAANGKKGGSKKKANDKQTESKKESASGLLLSDERQGSNPYGLQKEMKDEGGGIPTRNDGSLFTTFWYAYPETTRRKREDAWEAWKVLNPNQEQAAKIMVCLEAWKKSKRWLDDNGEFIPNAENFLDPQKGYLYRTPTPAKQAVPKGASGELGAAEMEAIQRVLREEQTT